MRKALHIIEKDKRLQSESKLKNHSSSPSPANLQKSLNSFDSASHSFRSINDDRASLSTNSIEIVSNETLVYDKLKLNEEENRIAEILFDLGLLLVTFDSKISKREAVECLQRSLDIKLLVFGPEHADCRVIKKKLSEVVAEYSSSRSVSRAASKLESASRDQLAPSGLSTRPGSSSVKAYVDVSPKKRIESLRKQNSLYANASDENDLSRWIKRNSIIEVIPSKRSSGRNG